VSSRQRLILLLVAAVVLAGGIALAASSGDDDSSDDGGTQASTPGQTQSGGDDNGGSKDKPDKVPANVTIRVKGSKPVGGVKTLKYRHGDTIGLKFVADKAIEVHIHGFDREIELEADEPVVTRFKANLEGIFEIEEHETDELLAKLEIRPK